jgi:hypothetical protein
MARVAAGRNRSTEKSNIAQIFSPYFNTQYYLELLLLYEPTDPAGRGTQFYMKIYFESDFFKRSSPYICELYVAQHPAGTHVRVACVMDAQGPGLRTGKHHKQNESQRTSSLTPWYRVQILIYSGDSLVLSKQDTCCDNQKCQPLDLALTTEKIINTLTP